MFVFAPPSAFASHARRHVKTLESRSQLLDAALASADEANRRWEECRTIVDQLRIENTTLRAALQATQAQLMALNPNANVPVPDSSAPGAPLNGVAGASGGGGGDSAPGAEKGQGAGEEKEQGQEGQEKK